MFSRGTMSIVDHRFEAFQIEEALLKDTRTLTDFAKCLRDTAQYPPSVRFATPIVVPRGGAVFGVHFCKGGRVMPREWTFEVPTYWRSYCTTSA